jgi:Mg2+/Co2+ transporter CorB
VYQAIAQKQAHLQSKKIAKELAFFPSHTPTFVQLESFLKPLPKKN